MGSSVYFYQEKGRYKEINELKNQLAQGEQFFQQYKKFINGENIVIDEILSKQDEKKKTKFYK